MRPLRYYLNITLDGCYDHRAGIVNEELHQYATAYMAQVDAIILGRITYQMMEEAWRPAAASAVKPDWLETWMEPFAHTIDAAKKYVVSSTLHSVDWNAELVRGDLEQTVRQLKREPGRALGVGGVQLAMALTEMRLIDEYEFVVHPRIAGHGPYLFAELSRRVDLTLVSTRQFESGAVAMRYTIGD